jgi:hypothetical protein
MYAPGAPHATIWRMTISVTAPAPSARVAPYIGRGDVDPRIANFFAPRLHAAVRERDWAARETLIAAREIAHASQGGALLVQMCDMPEADIERFIGARLPATKVDTAFRLAMLALGLRGEDL